MLASEQKSMLHAVHLAATSRATACNKVPEHCTQLEIPEPVHLESLGPGCGGCALCRGAFLHLHTHSSAGMKEIFLHSTVAR